MPATKLTVALRPYRVQATVDDKHAFPHHRSITRLWEDRWNHHAARGSYPFTEGHIDDFEPIYRQLALDHNDDPAVFTDPDTYAAAFFLTAEALYARAEAATTNDEKRDLYLRCAAVYRMARVPLNRTPLTNKAWQLGLQAYLKAAPLLEYPVQPVEIAYAHALETAGESTSDVIHAFVRLPHGEPPAQGWPVVLFMCGLDGYRTDQSALKGGALRGHLEGGQALVILDIPGTADCPAAVRDPTAADRLWSSVLDWVEQHAGSYGFDKKRIGVMGVSTGGYYAVRIAHTHADRLFGVCSQGGGCHRMFEEQWIRAQNRMEFPFELGTAVAAKFGYGSVDEFIAANPKRKLSLLESGMLDSPRCARLMLINGTEDSVFPIEDLEIVLEHGKPKEARLIEGVEHMGFPEASEVITQWWNDLVAATNPK